LDYEGAEILLGVPSKSAQARLRGCAKEPWTVQWIEGWIQPDEVLYDIGANVGAYSLVAALSPAVRARVVALEPGYPTFAALSDNVVRNGAQDRVTALPVALGRSTTLEILHLRTLDAGAALHTLGGHEGPSGAAYRQPVMTFRLDDLVERFGLPDPAHVKLDVDGTELDVLAGAERTLSDPSLRTVLTELDDREAGQLEAVLAGHGLHLRERFRSEKRNLGPDGSDAPQPPAYGLFTRGGGTCEPSQPRTSDGR
jgi:FkbM family methyltransferase